ncbi:hypothetical protein EYF80_015084 [Liparis tanakae]|uniref:Uncharacterized protein n=1 Tax=Liparis tanakae TaxID=230148 RepID=A0A4Z2I9R6_9TELE|nr:hypothetical protein EYF80_015084 [Liparis tanakae]
MGRVTLCCLSAGQKHGKPAAPHVCSPLIHRMCQTLTWHHVESCHGNFSAGSPRSFCSAKIRGHMLRLARLPDNIRVTNTVNTLHVI